MAKDETRVGRIAAPALALLDVDDVPAGLHALDALVKEAPVRVVSAGTVQCGRFLVLFGGEVEAVGRSLRRGLGVAGDAAVDSVLLPDAEARILPAIEKGKIRWPAPGDTLGVVQTTTPPTLLRAVDSALKGAQVDLVELRIAEGLGGRSIASLWGETHDVEAGIALAEAAIRESRAGSGSTVVIPNAEAEVARALEKGTRFFGEWRG